MNRILVLLVALLPLRLVGGEQATAVASLTAGFVTTISLTSGGSGYSREPAVVISGGGGGGATAKAILSEDKVSFVVVLNAGGGYTAVPEVSIEPPGKPMELGVRLVPEITVSGAPGEIARLEWSPALGPMAIWTPWTNIAIGNGSVAVVDLAVSSSQRFYRVIKTEIAANIPYLMALIPAGSFQMGDSLGDRQGVSYELPVHAVNVSAFYMGIFEVTKEQWDVVTLWAREHLYSMNTGSGKEAKHPVQTVSWYDVVKWCNARSEKEGRVPAYYTDLALKDVYRFGNVAPYVKWDAGYRLPTEAEWEKAARGGGSGHRFPWKDAETITHSRANYNSAPLEAAFDFNPTPGFHPSYEVGGLPYTSPVGSFQPNGYGLYDMAGNVLEWCWDWYGAYSSEPQTDPRGPTSSGSRILRGGAFEDNAWSCRVSDRTGDVPEYIRNWIGFRVVLPLAQ